MQFNRTIGDDTSHDLDTDWHMISSSPSTHQSSGLSIHSRATRRNISGRPCRWTSPMTQQGENRRKAAVTHRPNGIIVAGERNKYLKYNASREDHRVGFMSTSRSARWPNGSTSADGETRSHAPPHVRVTQLERAATSFTSRGHANAARRRPLTISRFKCTRLAPARPGLLNIPI